MLSFSTPLPWTKDFGRLGSRSNVDLELSYIERDQAGWDELASLNASVGAARISYWDLVSAALRLHTVSRQRAIIEGIAEKVQQRYDERLATDYDRVQALERLQNVLESEERACCNCRMKLFPAALHTTSSFVKEDLRVSNSIEASVTTVE